MRWPAFEEYLLCGGFPLSILGLRKGGEIEPYKEALRMTEDTHYKSRLVENIVGIHLSQAFANIAYLHQTPGQTGNRTVIGKSDVFEMFSNGLGVTKIVVLTDQAIKEFF